MDAYTQYSRSGSLNEEDGKFGFKEIFYKIKIDAICLFTACYSQN
jgi:hypothetical protein